MYFKNILTVSNSLVPGTKLLDTVRIFLKYIFSRSGSDLDQNCLQRLSAKVKILIKYLLQEHKIILLYIQSSEIMISS